MPKKNKKAPVWISTGSDVLDCVVGGGSGYGFPTGRIINIVGDKSSSKTFLACEIVASAYHMYGKKLKWVFDDCESGFSFDTQSLYGFEIMPENPDDRFSSDTVQDLFGNMRTFLDDLKSDEFGIYIVDSLDGLSSEEIEDIADKRYKAFKSGKTLDKGSYRMEAAKFLSQEFFRTLADDIQGKNVLLIIISQIRHNVDPLSFERYTRAGGKALDFYAYCALWLAKVKEVKKKDRVIGVTVKAKTKKLKAPRPYRECFYTILFDYGLDNIGTSLDFLYDLRSDQGTLLKVSKEIAWNENVKTMDRDVLIDYIEENDLQDELRNRVLAKWEEIEESVKVKRKAKYPKK